MHERLTYPKAKVTDVLQPPRCIVPFKKRLHIFQSYRQLAYTILIILSVNVVLDLLLPFHNVDSYAGTFLLSTAAVLYYNWKVFPYELIIDMSQWPQAPPLVIAHIERFFKEIKREGRTTIYAENLPEFLTWDEARIMVTMESAYMRVVGPGMMLSRLYKQLMRTIGRRNLRP